ncbi:MAG TPA: hypothetical protein VF269_06425 [Rhodanobacteraceae bacterium]
MTDSITCVRMLAIRAAAASVDEEAGVIAGLRRAGQLGAGQAERENKKFPAHAFPLWSPCDRTVLMRARSVTRARPTSRDGMRCAGTKTGIRI